MENTTATSNSKTEALSKTLQGPDEEEKGEKEEQEKETKKEEVEQLEEEKRETDPATETAIEELRPESITVDSQEVERFLKEPQQNGGVATSPETCL